ncbi:3-hydroxyacyl-[acyl-carrier-protein] dehydratase FabZ [Tetragenococcus osmophilus]|uniref:3-hydroxyacyl-[acyl-carrier-protein] dehydratase FabZ n=1 Tax=Tetragenococcus osmophilus TaxID=526944 RepID=A0ABM7AAP8_9ENTE|nr:3-hydroxyacyl-ACP dehydratase FabZ [Tetragenococcus osmophilus]AYW48522.1 3-hydroxyacyl-[acyl-carrier-protein] dehydratase FabZ [Tetragenococcus osmophilus]
MEKFLTEEEVKEVIPNRYPILYIDFVDTIESGKKIIATKNVTINEDFFQGHFPENPVMPGALILETLAQAGSILILKSDEFQGKTAYIGGINKAKFRQKVLPGDTLKLSFEITKIKGTVGTAEAKATVEDKIAAECEFTFIVGDQ